MSIILLSETLFLSLSLYSLEGLPAGLSKGREAISPVKNIAQGKIED